MSYRIYRDIVYRGYRDTSHSHPLLFAILAKLFNIIMFAGYVPYGFRLSYTVPLPKVDTVSTNAVENYKAISISPIFVENIRAVHIK